MKRIETIEEICLNVLSESPDPWVPLSTLISKCKEILGDDEMNENVIVSFLKSHPDVKVFEINLSEMQKTFEGYELNFQPYVILKKRLPREKDMLLWMYQHVENLLSLIDNMEKEAKTETKKQQISIVKKRATDLLNKLKNLSNKK